MTRGLAAGFICGAVVAAVVLAAMSLLTSEGLPGDTPPAPPGTAVPTLSADLAPAPDDPPEAPRRDENPRALPGQQVGAASAQDEGAISGTPAAMPQPLGPSRGLAPPASPTEGPGVPPAAEAPVPESNIVQLAEPDRPDASAPGRAAPRPVAPRLGTPADSRLPQVGAEAGPTPLAAPPRFDASATAALRAHAAAFQPEPDTPRLGILLRDVRPRPAPEALAEIDLPVTFVIDPEAEDAEEAMRAYREAGFEVVIGAALPQGATASDAETAWESWLLRVPEAVAVIEAEEGGFGGARESYETVIAGASRTGHGIVTWPRGLNPGIALAERLGVPAALVFFEFDDGRTAPDAMRRALGRAAFRASREAGIVVIGTARPETLEVLSDWQGDVDGRVQPVPISRSLTAG